MSLPFSRTFWLVCFPALLMPRSLLTNLKLKSLITPSKPEFDGLVIAMWTSWPQKEGLTSFSIPIPLEPYLVWPQWGWPCSLARWFRLPGTWSPWWRQESPACNQWSWPRRNRKRWWAEGWHQSSLPMDPLTTKQKRLQSGWSLQEATSALCTKARVQRTSRAVDRGCRSGDQNVLMEPMISHQRLAFVTCSFQTRLEAWERKNRVSGKRQFWDRIFKLKMVLGNPNTWLPHCAVNLSFEDQSCTMRIYKDWKGIEFTLVWKAVSSWFLSSLPWSLLPSSLSTSSSAPNHVCLFSA